MVAVSIILVILVILLAFFLFFKLLRGVLKAAIAVISLLLFVSAILGVIIYFDIAKVKKNFNEEQTILLAHKGEIVAGFSYDNSEDEKILQNTKTALFENEKLASFNSELADGDYSPEKGMTMVIDSSYFKDKSLELIDGVSITLTDEFIDNLLTCNDDDDCIDLMSEKVPSLQKQIEASFEDEQDMKNKIFFNLFVEESKNTKGTFLISGLKEDQIKIYPELSSLKIIKMVPEKFFKKIADKTAEFAEEKINLQE